MYKLYRGIEIDINNAFIRFVIPAVSLETYFFYLTISDKMKNKVKGSKPGLSWRCEKCWKSGNNKCFFKNKQSCQRHLEQLHKISDEVIITIMVKMIKSDSS